MRPKTTITHEEYESLIYKIFTSKDGSTLLSVWEDQFMYRKVALEGDDMLQIGLRQGEAQFVLSIINHIETLQNKDK